MIEIGNCAARRGMSNLVDPCNPWVEYRPSLPLRFLPRPPHISEFSDPGELIPIQTSMFGHMDALRCRPRLAYSLSATRIWPSKAEPLIRHVHSRMPAHRL